MPSLTPAHVSKQYIRRKRSTKMDERKKLKINNLFTTVNLNNKKQVINRSADNDGRINIDKEKKKSIWSLFSKVDDPFEEKKDADSVTDKEYNSKATPDKIYGDKATSDKIYGDKATTDKIYGDRATTDKIYGDRATTDKIYGDKATSDKIYGDKATSDKIYGDKATSDKIYGDKATTDRPNDDIFFTPRNAPQKKEETPRSLSQGLFKNMQENYDIKKEIENISNSFKRKNNILLSEKTDDSLLSNILSAKRIKTNKTKTEDNSSSYNSYKEFFLRVTNHNLKENDEKKKVVSDNLVNNKICYKIKDDNVLSRIKKENKQNLGDLEEKNRNTTLCNYKVDDDSITSGKGLGKTCPTTSDGEKKNMYTCIIKKKNICVPVNVVNENKNKKNNNNIKKLQNCFSKNDKFDIFNHIGDDVFRYILSNVKNKNMLLLNRRFCYIIRFLRLKLIYDESLKNTIPPESIIKTIYASENIEILDLSGCAHITSHHFNLLCNSNNIKFNKTLKILCLKNCNKICDSSLKALLHRFRNLKVVDIRNCYKISHEGIYPLKFRSTLTKLYIGNISASSLTNYHSNDSLRVLFGNSTNGSMAYGSSHDNKNNNSDYILLDTVLKNLVCFEITNAKQLNDISYLYMIAKNLKIFNLSGCNIDDSASIFFKSFTNLIALNLADTKISNEVMKTVVSCSKKLRILDISKTFEMDNNTILQISRNLTNLRKIKLSSLQDLTAIDFSSCWKVNNSFCSANGLHVASGCKLKDVGAYQCSIDRKVCEELKLFETSIYTDINSLEHAD
ncbi:leucine-rich repeat protein [Plasmodium brasilianum]|uniref:Leucine-rich repeat protein n=1 Tax=Plasmodium brasilianum TaxID=5824 RepID=A0ACB9Y8T4_PLABR|nr:leucine-rich repeat protein [Plasmodium brasilianum]